MKCQRCNEERIIQVSSKCSDRFGMSIEDVDYEGYVPYDIGIGGGDYIEFSYCLSCGQIQGEFPLFPVIEKQSEDEDIFEFYDNFLYPGLQIRINDILFCADVPVRFKEFFSSFIKSNLGNKYPDAETFVQMFKDDIVTLPKPVYKYEPLTMPKYPKY